MYSENCTHNERPLRANIHTNVCTKGNEMNEIFAQFGYGEIAGIAERVLDRYQSNIEDGTKDEHDALIQAMDDELIYTADQWEIMKYYCTPQDADLTEAFMQFETDLMQCIMDERKDT